MSIKEKIYTIVNEYEFTSPLVIVYNDYNRAMTYPERIIKPLDHHPVRTTIYENTSDGLGFYDTIQIRIVTYKD